MSLSWLLTHVPTMLRLRLEVQGGRRVSDREIFERLYHGMAPIWYFVFGIRRVTDLPDIDRILHQPYGRSLGALRNETVYPEKRDFLNAYLDQAPIGLALKRAVECAHLSRLSFPRPILDIGAGDGTFARMLFNGVIVDAGIDADEREIEMAKRTRCYSLLQTARVEELPFGSESFATVFSNCVLEHVAGIDSGLHEIHRVLRLGGKLYMTVPNPRCTTFLLWKQLFARLGLRRVGDWYASWILKLFKAEHIMEPEGWITLLGRAGFVVEHHEPYMPLKASRIQELFLPTAVLSVVSKVLLGRKLVFPRFHRLKVRLYRRLLRDAYAERSSEGSAHLFVARKVSQAAPSTQD